MNIAAVSKKFGITSDTLRYYEKVGLIPAVTRDKNGYRAYSKQDLRWVYFAKVMRNAGISVEALTKYVALFQQGREETLEKRRAILFEQRAILQQKISDLNETLDYLDYKIDGNGQHLAEFEKLLDPEETDVD